MWESIPLFCKIHLIANSEGTTRRWWTAGTDMWIEGRWICITTLTAVEDSVWILGQPGDTNNLNCLALHPPHGYLGYEENCEATRYSFCQLK